MAQHDIENSIVDAIELLTENKIAKARLDKTIIATVVSCVNKTTGIYNVKYQEAIIEAYSSPNVSYNVNDSVYVLIPMNDIEADKFILGKLGGNTYNGGGNERELTKVEYEALSIAEKNNGYTYYVTDEDSGGGGGSITVDDTLSTTSTNPVQNKVITNNFSNYATTSSLASYATTADLQDYATTSSLVDFVTTADLVDFVTTSDLTDYVTTSTLVDYVTTSDLVDYTTTADLVDFVTTADLTDYATTAELANYATTADLSGKQDTLTAGTNITIQNNVISAQTGGGSSALNYSETEQEIGTWIDGSTIYQKTIHFSNTRIESGTNLSHNIANISKVISCEYFMYGPLENVDSSLFSPAVDSDGYLGCYATASAIKFYGTTYFSPRANRTWYFTLRYTKTSS